MTQPCLIDAFVRPLEEAGIACFVTGGVASIVYGEPRFTRDIDLDIAPQPRDAARFLSLWPEPEFHAPPRETFEAERPHAARALQPRPRHHGPGGGLLHGGR